MEEDGLPKSPLKTIFMLPNDNSMIADPKIWPASLKFKTIFHELEKISEWFQREDIDLDEAFKKYNQGLALIKEAKAHLKKAENKFRVVAKQTK